MHLRALNYEKYIFQIVDAVSNDRKIFLNGDTFL